MMKGLLRHNLIPVVHRLFRIVSSSSRIVNYYSCIYIYLLSVI
jgi:hypothetical protein